MGLGTFLRSIVDRKYLGKNTVKKQSEIYYIQRNLYPDQPPHRHLAQTWLSRQSALGREINSQEMQNQAYSETLICACIQHPVCAEALGLFTLSQERPDIFKDYEEFGERFTQLIFPVLDLDEKGALEPLYRKYNPNMTEAEIKILFAKK